MSTPDLLTETDFLVREFPAPANPHRPLAIVAPRPDEDRGAVAACVERLARHGFGGVILDPAPFGLDFLGETWFDLVGSYVEGCRLVGLFLWLLDGFTAGSPLGAILDEALPGWRGQEITSLRVPVAGPNHLDLTLAEPAGGRLLAVVARPSEDRQPPLDLMPHTDGGRLQWDPPAGRWEIICLRASQAQGPPAASFRWSDASLVSSWLKMGFAAYQELFGPHLGRTIQGFFTFCPTWPTGGAWPMLAPGDPSWPELAGLLDASGEAEAYFIRAADTLLRSYQAPLREWCWRHRLRLAGYRLGGSPIPGTMADFDLGGLPDLSPGAMPDLPELAGLAGLAHYYRQERVACQVPLSGEAWHDRTSLGRLAAVGADLFLFRPQEEAPPDYELALNDYAARVAMAIAAGGPAEQEALVVGASPAALRAAGETALALAVRGVEAICLPAAEAVSLGEVDPGAATETAAAGPALTFPVRLPRRARKVDNWAVHTLFNLSRDRWRGPLGLTESGATEIWCPSTGEQRPTLTLAADNGPCLPMALEPGEAMLVVLRRSGTPSFSGQSQLISAHLNLGRSWRFEAPGGNILPLFWQEQAPGSWRAVFTVLTVPAELHLVDKPEDSGVWLNGSLIPADEHGMPLHRQAVPGENVLEIIGTRGTPASRLKGQFVCRGLAVAIPPEEMSGPWTLNGYPHYPGPGIYRQSFEVPAAMVRSNLVAWLEISALADFAALRLNGEEMGFLPWPPFRLDLGLATCLRPGQNLLELEVHAPAAKPAWAFKGLLGEVSLLFGEAAVEVKDPFAI